MQSILENQQKTSETTGLAHFAISVGSKERVDEYTQCLASDGYEIIGLPRTTGDGNGKLIPTLISIIIDVKYHFTNSKISAG